MQIWMSALLIMGDASMNVETHLDHMLVGAIMDTPYMRMGMTAKKVVANMKYGPQLELFHRQITLNIILLERNVYGSLQLLQVIA